MKENNFLAIDTATEACSVALQCNNQIVSKFEICPQQHSQRLLPMVDEVLNEANTVLDNLGGLVFGRGPGSFTGVRIATGMIQGLALGTDLPVVGVSTLAAMAVEALEEASIGSQVAVAIDARMSEVYFAVYQKSQRGVELVVEEQVCPPDVAHSLLTGEVALFAGTGWQAYEVLNFAQEQVAVTYPSARAMLTLGEQAFAEGFGEDVEAITPVYLRDKVTWKKLPGRE